MNTRRPVQERHERFIVDEFARWWATQSGEGLSVIDRPNPPEAMVESDRRTSWIEVTVAYFSGEWARDLSSYATTGETHKPMGPGFHADMDEHFAARFARLLRQKLSKESYRDAYKAHGPGILVIVLQTPWLTRETIAGMREACDQTDWSSDRGFFAQVFISYQSMGEQAFEPWHMHRKPALGKCGLHCRRESA